MSEVKKPRPVYPKTVPVFTAKDICFNAYTLAGRHCADGWLWAICGLPFDNQDEPRTDLSNLPQGKLAAYYRFRDAMNAIVGVSDLVVSGVPDSLPGWNDEYAGTPRRVANALNKTMAAMGYTEDA